MAKSILRFDFPSGTKQPNTLRFLIASLVAILGSLVACAALIAIGTSLFPSIAGYEHFQFTDYGKLTILGVLAACVAWPATTWVSSDARRLFFWLALVVTIVGFAPDIFILYRGQPPLAVLILALMHVALAVVTYPALVYIAPQQSSIRPR